MKTWILSAGLAAALVLPALAAPTAAQASCADRKTTGAILGGVGGALIGNSLARGGGGLVLGGLGGALLGHEIAGSGCRHPYRPAYYGPPPPAPPPPQPSVYYDQYGDPVIPGQGPPPPGLQAAAGPTPGACRTRMQPYYDDRGALITVPVKDCR